jgi:hypothetical protein
MENIKFYRSADTNWTEPNTSFCSNGVFKFLPENRPAYTYCNRGRLVMPILTNRMASSIFFLRKS